MAADTYVSQLRSALGIFKESHEYLTLRKAELVEDLYRRLTHFREPRRILDVGCGIGLTDKFLIPKFHEVHGVDVDRQTIEEASRNNPLGRYREYDGRILPYENSTFHMAVAINVIHHILPEKRSLWLQEVARVIQKGGLIICMEHNPYNPVTQFIVSRCEFDKDANLITSRRLKNLLKFSGLLPVESGYFLLSPFQWKSLLKIEKYFNGLPIGAQYYVVGRKPH